MKVVIIGGVAGGASAAARIRRLDERAEIVVFEKSGYVSYANCGLPYYIGGTIQDSAELTLQTPESFYARFRVDVRVHHEVCGIDTTRRKVTVKNLQTGAVFEEGYDKLLIATGARPAVPPIGGEKSEQVFTLRTVEDTLKIKAYIDARKPRTALIVGGGFIGLEMAENLRGLGIDVTLVQGDDQLMTPVVRDMAAFIHGEVKRGGVRLYLSSMVDQLEEEEEKIRVRLKDGTNLTAELVILAIGVVPDTALAEKAGLKLGAGGGIVVNPRMETSCPDVYAVGDAVETTHFVTGGRSQIPLAGPANKQGRIAADNICGGDSRYGGGQASSVLKVFDLTAAVTGINENAARAAGIAYDKVILSPLSHAGYYPGGTVMTMKVLFEKETYRLLGAQIIGRDGVDKRIDVLATALRAGLKGYELAELELASAPPYSSAKDPVNIAGYMIGNLKDGLVRQWYYEDAAALPRDGSAILLDTRTAGEYARGHIEGFLNIPVDELRERLGELERGKPVYVICQSGLRSYIACRILAENGFDAYNFAGGFRLYDVVFGESAPQEKAAPCGLEP